MKLLRRGLLTLLVGFILLNTAAVFQAYKLTRFYDSAPPYVPTEQGTFWNKTKAILFGVSAQKSRNSVLPDTPYETIYFKTSDGFRLEGWYIQDPHPKGTVILFHGHGGSKSGVLQEGYYFASLGYNLLLVDFRAHGGSQGNICTMGFKESADVKAAWDYTVARGEKNIILWGTSLGASTIIKAISDYNIKPKKIILEMPFGSLLQAVRGRVRLMGLPEEPISSLLTFWGGVEHGFFAFGFKPCAYAKKISCPVLLQWGQKDPRVTRSEIDCIYSHLQSKDRRLVIYENGTHASLYENAPGTWRKEISSFMLQ
ncbi:MAG TPA: alpha/beta fold hydrolase [Puia sp.]|jgi:dipeptidyl aminopeptidase/acylaminoacyl peptidase|nr:alpha/beta fold hydrolase [Puia sp.]